MGLDRFLGSTLVVRRCRPERLLEFLTELATESLCERGGFFDRAAEIADPVMNRLPCLVRVRVRVGRLGLTLRLGTRSSSFVAPESVEQVTEQPLEQLRPLLDRYVDGRLLKLRLAGRTGIRRGALRLGVRTILLVHDLGVVSRIASGRSPGLASAWVHVCVHVLVPGSSARTEVREEGTDLFGIEPAAESGDPDSPMLFGSEKPQDRPQSISAV